MLSRRRGLAFPVLAASALRDEPAPSSFGIEVRRDVIFALPLGVRVDVPT